MKKTTMRLFALAMLMMVSMGAEAKIDVQIANDGKFDGGTIEVTNQKDLADGVEVTITVTPNDGYTITKGAITVVSTYPPTGNSSTRTPEIANNLTLYYNGSAEKDVDDTTAKRDYTFTVPSGFGAWVKEATFTSGSKGGGTRVVDYSGIYYIGTLNQADGYYLCPTKEWYNYKSSSPFYSSYSSETGDEQPFLTTYKCKSTSGYDSYNAVWIVEKQSNGYYYIKHASDKKYLTYNDAFLDNKGRVRVHLEDSPAIEDFKLFKIEYVAASSSYDIISKYAEDNNEYPDKNKPRKYLNINKGNQQSLQGTTADNTQAIPSGGIIGFWTAGSSEVQATGRFFLEEAQCSTPIISYDSSTGEVTITSKTEGVTIYYTTDGTTDPSSSSSSQYDPANKPTISGNTTIKAIAVKAGLIDSEVATIRIVTNPAITLTIPDGGYTYDKTEKKPGVSLEDGDTTIDSSEYEVSYSNNINAGTNTATVTITGKEGGNLFVNGTTTFTIAPKALTVTADAKTKSYGDSDPELTYTATGLVEGDALEGSLSRAEGENVGTYAISQGTLANSNYSISFTGDDLTITQKSLGEGGEPAENITIDVNNDGNNYVVTVKQGENTLTQGTDYTWTGSGNEFEYTVTVTGIGNYSGTAQATYVAATPGYYVLHQNGKGYLKVSGVDVNLGNDGTFQSGNLFDKGNCIWYMTPQGYLQNEYFYLNVANNKTLYLSVYPVTRWRSEDVTGENTYNKKHLKIYDGTNDLYLCNDGNSITLKASPTAFYSACPVEVEEVSWTGPAADNLTVQSPQLVTYLRAYFTQKIKYSFHNDAGTEVKSTDGKHERRVYATLAYASGGDGKGTNWDIDESGILYNKKASGDVEFTATYNILPADTKVRGDHSTAATKDIKYKVTQKPLAVTAGTDYLLFSISGGDSYRYPYDNGVADGDPVKPDGPGGTGNTSVLTDPDTNKNLQISWKITVDAEGFYTFQNLSSNKYLYFDEAAHASSDYGVLRLGDAPTGNNAKFRLYKTSDTNYGDCYFIIPYSKLFAVYKSDGLANGLYVALNNKDYTVPSTKVISLYRPTSDHSIWCIYKYEAEYRIREDFMLTGPSTADVVGNYEFIPEAWYGKYIKQSPKTGTAQNRLVIKGTYKVDSNIDYQWTVTGLGTYINITDGTNTDGTWTKTTTGNANNRKLVVNVTSLPVSSTSGVVKLILSGYTAPSENVRTSSEKTLAFTILGDGTVTFTDINSLDKITSSSGAYRLVGGAGSNFAYSASNKPGVTSFSGVLDGNNQTISGLSAPLFDNLTNGTVRNVNLSGVSISSHSGATGAIAGTADGGSRIYNVGILDGEVGSSDNVCGGLVGTLDGSARVINCFSYATITGGTNVGGIVGNNTYASTANDPRTMVMNCMFYGDITGGTNKAPIYNGTIITNRGDASGVSNFNYFWGGASYVTHRDANNNPDIQTYNCALMAETRFLQRFEFFRHVLNGHRELAAWWATGSADNKDMMMKWVLEPSQIGTDHPYPILKAPKNANGDYIQYPSVVNIDAAHAEAFDDTNKKLPRNKGRKFGTLTINIQNGSGGPTTGANITTESVTPNITDKDPDHFNFNYYKVQLPYYNDVGTGNYTQHKVVTGWKIKSVRGVEGAHTFSTGTMPADATASVTDGNITLTTPYNYADRKCTQKDVYDTNGHRIFNQGAYFDVPEGVTSITIEPYWAKCVYVADAYPDVVYNKDMNTAYNVTTVGGGQRYENGKKYNLNTHSLDETNGQNVYTSMANAVTALNPSGTVYDNAIVLVGNVHNIGITSNDINKPYTIMSIDLDKDNEPDYSYILRFDGRNKVHPVRIDFLNVIGLGMAQKSHEGTGTYNFGIMQPNNWFECTNTGLFRVTQLEYDQATTTAGTGRTESPMILHGGVIEQWVAAGQSEQTAKEAKAVSYYHVGGNVWFKEFHIGVHQDKTQDEFWSPHPPISVSGGDYDIFYLTGYYNTPGINAEDNAECYINGGRFGKVAGTGMQGIGKTGGANNTGNIFWQIDNADIDEFYAGGINAAHKAEGNIYTVITNSRVDQFCGGPKFGDMNSDKIVVTNAENCTFRTFFGAGYGGNSYNRKYPANKNNVTNLTNPTWNTWVSQEHQYQYNGTGVDTRIDYQFIPMSGNTSNVARLFVDYVSFSLATTHNVTTKLTGCTITKGHLGRLDVSDNDMRLGNFYGGGSLGKVNGPIKSTLTNCIVEGNVFGAGYSASTPTVSVMGQAFQTEPRYNQNLGVYLDAVPPTTTEYQWEHKDVVNSTATAIKTTTDDHILYTEVDLSQENLGSVSGQVTLTLMTSGENGETVIGTEGNLDTGHVYGGGDESYVSNKENPTAASTTVNLRGNTLVRGNVFGGGNEGLVTGSAIVNIE